MLHSFIEEQQLCTIEKEKEKGNGKEKRILLYGASLSKDIYLN